MRALLLLSLLLAGSHLSLQAAQSVSALSALKHLPEDDLQQLAQIIGPEGDPQPDRWYILVHSKESETGLKEYVVADGELVAERQISQFADSLAPDSVIQSTKLKTDSDRLANLAFDYAQANSVSVTQLSFSLGKDKESNEPVWQVACQNSEGELVGKAVANANTGKIVSHEGFPIEPKTKTTRKPKKLKLKTEARPQVAVDQEVADPAEAVVVARSFADGRDSYEAEPVAEQSAARRSQVRNSESARSSGRRAKRASVPDPVTAVRDVTRPIRRSIGRLLPF